MQTNHRLTGSFLTGALLLAGAAVSANADTGTLPVGSTYCAAPILSSNGAEFYGGTGQSPVVLNWTVTASTTVGGAGSTLFTSKARSLEPVTVHATPAGTYFYRVCIENASKFAIGFGLYIDPPGAYTPVVIGGPATAVLGPGGNFCGGFSEGSAKRVGQSNDAVEWYVELFDGDGDDLGSAFNLVAASINDIVSPISGAFYIEACVSNVSQSTATLSLSLTPE